MTSETNSLMGAFHITALLLGHSLFNWVEALAVPVVIATISGLFLVAAQRAAHRYDSQREWGLEEDRNNTLRAYLDRISELILEHGLAVSTTDSPVRAVAVAQTYAALRVLDGPRNGILVRFLHESHLINGSSPVISLSLADLVGSTLSSADLQGCNFSEANLNDADFDKADLREAIFKDTVISADQLTRAADLVGAIQQDGTVVTEEIWSELKSDL